jgi:hypothetical protein
MDGKKIPITKKETTAQKLCAVLDVITSTDIVTNPANASVEMAGLANSAKIASSTQAANMEPAMSHGLATVKKAGVAFFAIKT